MKERPIIMQSESVRAILDGRKTQTRRVAKLTDSGRVKAVGSARNWHLGDPNAALACPHGQPGDRLWVKEVWAECLGVTNPPQDDTGIRYRAQREAIDIRKWKSPLFMPRWASRITLELVKVRVERVQDISEEDVWEEGCAKPSGYFGCPGQAQLVYKKVWQSIHGKKPARRWEANPWVWVLEFKRVTP